MILQVLFVFASIGLGLQMIRPAEVKAGLLAQQPTGTIPTVTGTPEGPMLTLNLDQVIARVRSGPGQEYPEIGILVQGQKLPALGISRDKDWVKFVYLGAPEGVAWVSSYRVTVNKPQLLHEVDVPPTPTQRVTPTLDPTIAAQYLVEAPPTLLPTYTPPPPIAVPTIGAEGGRSPVGSLPIGFIIIGLAVVGFFGTMISILRGR